jgi:hypothetical protein
MKMEEIFEKISFEKKWEIEQTLVKGVGGTPYFTLIVMKASLTMFNYSFTLFTTPPKPNKCVKP